MSKAVKKNLKGNLLPMKDEKIDKLLDKIIKIYGYAEVREMNISDYHVYICNEDLDTARDIFDVGFEIGVKIGSSLSYCSTINRGEGVEVYVWKGDKDTIIKKLTNILLED